MAIDTEKRKTSILHILNSMDMGGTERRVLRLKLGLDPERYTVRLLTLRPSVAGASIGWPENDHTYFPIAPGIHWRRLADLARLIRQEGFDVVHTHNWGTMFYGVLAARLAGVPLILHGEHGRNDQDRVSVPWKRELVAGVLARLATKVVAVNAFIASEVRERWRLADKHVLCVPNGVDVERFHPRAEAGPREGEFIVGTITRFDSIKNLPCLVRAFERFHEACPDINARLVVVGGGPDFESVKARAQRGSAARSIDLVGETDVPEDWYRRFDVFVNTSFSEGMSNSLLEAMACGLPIVASAIPGNLCWLTQDSNALFFPSDDDAALGDCLARLARDRMLARRLGEENLRLVEARYDNRNFLRDYDDLYRRMLGRKIA